MSHPRLICYDQYRPTEHLEFELRGGHIRIGSSGGTADVELASSFILPNTAELVLENGVWTLNAAVGGLVFFGNSTTPLRRGESERVYNGSTFRLQHWICRLYMAQNRAAVGPGIQDEAADLLKMIHADLLKQGSVRIVTLKDPNKQYENAVYIREIESVLQDIIKSRFQALSDNVRMAKYIAGQSVKSDLIATLFEVEQADSERNLWDQNEVWRRYQQSNSVFEDDTQAIISHFNLQVQERLQETRDGQQRPDPIDLIDECFPELWEQVDLTDKMLAYLTEKQLIKQTKDIIWGFGPLEDLLRVPAVSEIMVVDRNHIYVERSGVLQDSGRQFISDEVTCNIIDRIVGKVNRSINQSSPLVDARLPDGSRVNAVIPPIAVTGPCLTIRKFPKNRLRLRDLQMKGAMTETVRKFLEAAVGDHRNILIAGGTGTGKTTLLNGLSDAIDPRERIVTVEDTAELQIGQEHVVSLESRPPNVEGRGAYTIRDLVKNALRMRPDRIIVGECRGPEALDMLQAMNTGHDGSMTTIHANTPEDVINRLVVLVQSGNDVNMPVESIYQQIAAAIDLIVQLTRFGDGRRLITQVTQITGLNDEGRVEMRDLFVMTGKEGEEVLMPTGRLPTFIDRIVQWDAEENKHSQKLDLASFYV